MTILLLAIIYIAFIGLGVPDSLIGSAWPAIFPELGVPVTFADISSFCAIFELAESSVGYRPELSYGSHMFQDLVEANIFYGALFEDTRTLAYDTEALRGLDFREVESDDPELQGIVFTARPSGATLKLFHDSLGNETLCALVE